MKNLLSLLLAFAVVCGLTSCSSVDVATAGLKVELVSLEKAGDGTVRATWRVLNPNIFPYLLHKTDHKVSLNGTLAGTFSDEAPLGVPAQNQAERTGVLVPAKNTPAGLIDQAIAQGSAAYRLETTATMLVVDDNYEKITFTGAGTVPVTAKK